MEGGKNLYILSVTVTWFLPKEQIDQMKGRFTESFREAWNWHYNLSSFQTAGNCKQYQKLKGKTEEFLCIVSDQSTCYANDSHI